MNPTRKTFLAAAFVAPLFVLATPALASAANDDGQSYSSTQTNTNRDGVSRTTTNSCMGSDGDVVFERSTQSANAQGRTSKGVESGNASCDSGNVQEASTSNNNADSASDGQNFSRSETFTGKDGVGHRSANSCTDSNGDVAFEGNRQSANANGRTSRTVNSGNSSCGGNSAQANQDNAAENSNSETNQTEDTNTSGSAPLVVINGGPLSR